MANPYIEVKTLKEASYLVNNAELQELKNILAVLKKRGCTSVSVAIMPKHEIANSGVWMDACFSINGYNPEIKVGFRMEHEWEEPTVRNLDWAEDDFIQARYPFQLQPEPKMIRRQAARVMLWNRVR